MMWFIWVVFVLELLGFCQKSYSADVTPVLTVGKIAARGFQAHSLITNLEQSATKKSEGYRKAVSLLTDILNNNLTSGVITGEVHRLTAAVLRAKDITRDDIYNVGACAYFCHQYFKRGNTGVAERAKLTPLCVSCFERVEEQGLVLDDVQKHIIRSALGRDLRVRLSGEEKRAMFTQAIERIGQGEYELAQDLFAQIIADEYTTRVKADLPYIIRTYINYARLTIEHLYSVHAEVGSFIEQVFIYCCRNEKDSTVQVNPGEETLEQFLCSTVRAFARVDPGTYARFAQEMRAKYAKRFPVEVEDVFVLEMSDGADEASGGARGTL